MIPASDLWMLGLRPVSDNAGDPAPPSRPAGTGKYVVAERLGGWRVQRDGADAGAFVSLEDAVNFACAQAREQARTGVLGVVVVQSEVREMHCFTPPAGAVDGADSPRLRVVGSAGL